MQAAIAIKEALRPGMRVYVAGSTGEPQQFVAALRQQPELAAEVTFIQFPLPGLNATDFTRFHPRARMETFFLVPELQESFRAGRVDYLPMQLRRVYDYLATGPRIDLACFQVAPLNEKMRFPFAFNLDFAPAVLANATSVWAEINAACPKAPGMGGVTADRIDFAVECSYALAQVSSPKVDATAQAIGEHVAALIGDGDCLQIGIGAIPAAVMQALKGKNDLGFHSGLLDSSVRELIELGVMNGARKSLDRHKAVTAMAVGDHALFNWISQRENIVFRSSAYTHEYTVLKDIDNFVSINSAVEVDLYGQVNAEMIGARQLSGTGGSVDFMRGAAVAANGRSVVALLATAKGGVSRIVPNLGTGAATTALRTDVDYVVTEYGSAALKNRSLDARAEALIAIAAPAIRAELSDRWREQRRGA